MTAAAAARDPLATYRLAAQPYYAAAGNEVALFEQAWRHRLPLLLKGPTGCGKTRFVEYMAWRLGLPLADEIVAVFCGSKKTLASGVPMARLLFGGHPALGVLVLPILFYHQLQLFVCAVMARRYARQVQAGEPAPG